MLLPTIVIEFIGTFICSLSIYIAHNFHQFVIPFIIGLTYLIMLFPNLISSGGYFNPVITLTLFLNSDINIKKFIILVIIQVIAAVCALLVYKHIISI